MTVAIDLGACPTWRVGSLLCHCAPCRRCGLGPHMAAHAPRHGEPLDSAPYDHEYNHPGGEGE